MKKILMILQKEWWDLRGQRFVWLGFILFPLIMILAAGSALTGSSSGASQAPTPSSISELGLNGMTSAQIAQATRGAAARTVFFLIPFVLPTILAAYSVAGEKTARTLEPLLATPLPTWQLLVGKALTALLPTVLVTWLSAACFTAEVIFLELSPRELPVIISPGWVTSMLVMAPVMTLLPIGVTVIISARVSDLRLAQQLATLVGMLLGILIVGFTVGVVLSPLNVLAISTVLLLAGAAILWLAARLFQREAILTRWE